MSKLSKFPSAASIATLNKGLESAGGIDAINKGIESVGGIDQIAKMGEGAKSYLSSYLGSNTGVAGDALSSPIGSNEIIEMPNIATLETVKYVITIILVLWGASMILIELFVEDKDKKESIRNSHNILMGGTGILPAIFIIWVTILLVIVILPVIISSAPQINKFFSNITKGVGALLTGK